MDINWNDFSQDELGAKELNFLIRQNRIIAVDIDAVKVVKPLSSGWSRYVCRMRVDDEGDVMTRDFYVRKTAHSIRNTAPLFVDGWWYANSGMSQE